MRRSDTVADRTPDSDEDVPSTFLMGLSERVNGRRVCVESGHGQRFEGLLEQTWLEQRHVLLRNVQELPGGARYPSAFVANVDWIVLAEDDADCE